MIRTLRRRNLGSRAIWTGRRDSTSSGVSAGTSGGVDPRTFPSSRARQLRAVLPAGEKCTVPTYRDEGTVLRTQKLGEADRIITLLTRRNGRIRAVARGVRKTSSRIGARLEPFNHVDVQFYEGKSLDNVTQVETIDAMGGRLADDYARWTAGTAMLETAERLRRRTRTERAAVRTVGIGLEVDGGGRARTDLDFGCLPFAFLGGRGMVTVLRRVRSLCATRAAPSLQRARGWDGL